MDQVNSNLTFEELRSNYTPEQALVEANRCLYCYDAPCRQGCPVNIDIPNFIQSIKTGNTRRAARLINDANPFGSVCGRVCPVERLCVEKCVLNAMDRPIRINMLQRFATDNGNYQRQPVPKNGDKVAVIGSGPAGLACASELARNGFEVNVYESKSVAGGMVAMGVPEYRCPHNITASEVAKIEKEGVTIKTSTPVNRNVAELFDQGYKAVFIGVGLTKTSRPNIPGMNLKGVYMGLDFLNRIGAGETPDVGRKVVTIGGGDTALDCARSALRLGSDESTLMYRRSFVELPADKEEIEESLQEGIIFRTLTQPVAFHGDANGVLRAVEAVDVKLGPPDKSGRRSPVIIKNSNYRIAANTVIFATGTEPSKLLQKILPDAEYINDKFLKVDPDTKQTSVEGVFAGGDVVNKGATVVQAVAEGKAAAFGIMKYIEAKKAEPVKAETPAHEEIPIEKKVEEKLEKARETLKKLEGEDAPPEPAVKDAPEIVQKVEADVEEALAKAEEIAEEADVTPEIETEEEEPPVMEPEEPEEAEEQEETSENGLDEKREAILKQWEEKLKEKK